MTQTKKIQINFREQTEFGIYSDSLYFTMEEFLALTQEDIDILAKNRIESWIEKIKNPPIEIIELI